MSPQQQREEEIFAAAFELPPEQRAAYLAEACAGDPQLLAHVQGLLAALNRASPLLKQPPPLILPQNTIVLTAKPGDKIGRYKLLEQIGEGGCGVVYVAEQEEPVRRRVALKVIKLGMDTKEVIARFDAERQALAMMDHPNIARIHDAGATDTGRPFFVMELVRGIKITDYCKEHQLSPRERLDLFIKVCLAIQHAHQKGIIHRDIKPSNILVTSDDGVPVPKVIDFGIAKATQGKLTDQTVYTALEQFIGTPAYMSPEQAQLSMQDIDTRSDIYSLGVLLYELLTGTTPFETEELLAKGLDEMRRTIREVEPPKPSTRLTQSLVAADVRRLTSKSDEKNSVSSRRLIQEIKGDLDLIVMKCLEKDRTRRYETATGLSADILRHLNDEPISARPPSKLYEFQRTFKRHKFGFAATAAVIVALAAGLAVSTRMYWAAQIEKKNAQAEKKKAQTEAARSEQVAQFMKDMLKGVGPSVSLGRDTRLLKEILDQTAERLGKDLTDQLAVQAELRATLGNVYRDLGEYTNAAAMYRETFEQRKKMFGLEHPDTAASLYELGEALRLQGRNSEAEPAIREALRIRKKLFGDKHLEVARSLDSLALLIYYWRRQWGESEALFREALDIRRKLLGNAHVEVADSLTHLGVMLNSHGRYAEAEAAHREALALRRKLLGSEHPEIARSLHEVAWSLRLAGNLAEAESMFREALAMRRKLLDEGHPDLVDTLLNLGRTFEDARKFDDAAALYREALEMIRKRLGSDHPRMVSPLSSLATVLSRQGKLTEAERLCRQALAINTDSYGGWLPSVTFLTDNLTRVLREEGKTNEAETVAHLKAVEVAEKNRKLADQGNPQAQEYMGWAYLNGRGVVKDPVEAVKWYRKAAEQDNTDVQNFLGWMYANGQDVPRDHVEADKWYRKAAEAGNRWAQHSLALQYLTGSGVPRDDREALKLFRKAADQDHQPAQLLLARMYAEGRGVETNRTEAACWYEKAIRIADPSALNQYAWFLATSLEPAFRDGTKAIALAEKAAAATGRTNVMVLDTLAVAYAEAGQFEKAISVQKDAIVRLSSREDRPILESHLKLFESRTPLRE